MVEDKDMDKEPGDLAVGRYLGVFEDGHCVGCWLLVNTPTGTEFHTMLTEKVAGKGLRLCRGALAFLFDQGWTSLSSYAPVWNLAAVRILHKLHFKPLPLLSDYSPPFRKFGKDWPTRHYTLTKEDYYASNPNHRGGGNDSSDSL